jgi:hypothetical protein
MSENSSPPALAATFMASNGATFAHCALEIVSVGVRVALCRLASALAA